MNRIFFTTLLIIVLIVNSNILAAKDNLKLYLNNSAKQSLPDLSEDFDTSGDQFEFQFYPPYKKSLGWDNYYLPYDISGNTIKFNLYFAEASSFSQVYFVVWVKIGDSTRFSYNFTVTGEYYNSYTCTYNSDTLITAKAGDEVKLYVYSAISQGVAGIIWGTVDSYIEIPGNAVTEVENINISNVNSNFIELTPNPVNSETEITYSIEKSTNVSLSISNFIGREIIKIIDNEFTAQGSYQKLLNLGSLPSGIYFCSLKTDESIKTVKFIITK